MWPRKPGQKKPFRSFQLQQSSCRCEARPLGPARSARSSPCSLIHDSPVMPSRLDPPAPRSLIQAERWSCWYHQQLWSCKLLKDEKHEEYHVKMKQTCWYPSGPSGASGLSNSSRLFSSWRSPEMPVSTANWPLKPVPWECDATAATELGRRSRDMRSRAQQDSFEHNRKVYQSLSESIRIIRIRPHYAKLMICEEI